MKNQILIALISGIAFIAILCSCDLKVGGSVNSDTKLDIPPEPRAFTEESSEMFDFHTLRIIKHHETGKRYILITRGQSVAIIELK